MTETQQALIKTLEPELVWHQYHTYLCILESDMRLSVSSRHQDTREHPAYAGLIIMGKVIIKFLKVDVMYCEPDWTRLMLLGDLVPKEEQPYFPEEVAGRLTAVWDIWKTWTLKGLAMTSPGGLKGARG